MSNPLADAHAKGYVSGLKQFGIVDRRDVDVLLHDYPDTFNLFLLAIKQLQDGTGKPGEFTDWKDRFSFFQIAGIHGLPHALWDGVGGKKSPSREGSGYCAHGTQTFPAWHRPYLAMLEQALYEKMIDIVERYDEPRKSVYREAVKQFRLPYWDYHRPRDYNARFPGVRFRDATTFFPYDFRAPQIFTVTNVKVKMYPGDQEVQIPNPLNKYTYPDANTGFFTDRDWNVTRFDATSKGRKETERQIDSDWSDHVSALNATINNVREDMIRLSLNFIENGAYNSYIDFATAGVWNVTDPLDGQRASGSLEGMHGDYHGYIGNGGHMSEVPTAAYDPIFWFHHCQIDRYFAIWQAAHPTDPDKPDSSKTQVDLRSWLLSSDRAGTKASDPLLPFRYPDQTKAKFWNSTMSYRTSAFGYRYPELNGSDTTPAQDVQKRFENMYSWARRLTNSQSNKAIPPKDMEPLNLDNSQFFHGIPDFTPLKKPKSVVLQPTFSTMGLQEVPELAPVTFSLKAEAPAEAFAVKAEPIPIAEAQAPITTNSEVQITEKKVSREWYIDDVVQRLALNGSFTILYFLGAFDTDTDPAKLALAPTFFGNTHVFTSPVEACDNCGNQATQAHLVTNTTPMTAMLLDYEAIGQLQSLRPEHVKPFLIKNLKWRIVGPDGQRVDPRMLSESKDFKLGISCKVAPLPGEQGEVAYETFPDIVPAIIGNAS